VHIPGVVLPLTEQRAPSRAARVVRTLRIDVPLRIGLPRLRVPLRRSAHLQVPGGGAAEPIECGGRVAGLDKEMLAERRGPLEVADIVMRMMRVPELPDSRIRSGGEVLALALPPPLREHRDLVVRSGLPRQPDRGTTHVGVQ